MANFFRKILTAGEGRELKRYEQMVGGITDLESHMQQLSDEELRGNTVQFRERYANGEDLSDILTEAFATVREASVRATGLRHFDVQLIGGMVLNDGKIAEMKTGEGKTLVSTLAGYLNAIPGSGVHIVTVNDYLAKRDSQWMGSIYRFLGLDVGLIQNGMKLENKTPAYAADITYGTNAEFGFDYLRDNMVTRGSDRVQRDHAFAIVDEVDSILIDEARTPLIISGAGTRAAETYIKFARAVPALRQGADFEMDEAKKTIYTTEGGLLKIEHLLGMDDIYSDPSGQLPNHLQQALRAQFLYHRDIDYVVVDGEVKIVDEFTGRILEGRRYSEGLHQALEAKEGVLVREENQTLATITLQNYFRLYDKLSGMTGTALTEDGEFREIYNLPVQAIPPNKPVVRDDRNDQVYRTIDAKFNAVADDIHARHEAGQPCLVGTVSIESSEKLSRLLDKRGIHHEVLNAKFHEHEAHIIAQAGRKGMVTIATNMAGRGTDIVLGGNPDELCNDMLIEAGIEPEEAAEEQIIQARNQAEVVCAREHDEVIAAGGLCVIGTERHEARRIDNQLRGRSGRQGDPGVTQFYLSLEDDLMRLFGGDRMDRIGSMMAKTKMPDDMPIEANMVSKAIESAQRQVEAMNFDMRKRVLEYDDVMNKQRSVIYEERDKILDGKDIHARVDEIMADTVEKKVAEYCDERSASDDWDWDGLSTWLSELSGRDDFNLESIDCDDDVNELEEAIIERLKMIYSDKESLLGETATRHLESQVMLRVIDTRWMNHLADMDYLKTGIGLRGYGQRDPLTEYKTEAYRAFGELVDTMYEDYLRTIMRIRIAVKEESPNLRGASYTGGESVDGDTGDSTISHAKTAAGAQRAAAAEQTAGTRAATAVKPATFVKDKDDPFANVGRNDPCPCGSGLKYKKCHGAVNNR